LCDSKFYFTVPVSTHTDYCTSCNAMLHWRLQAGIIMMQFYLIFTENMFRG